MILTQVRDEINLMNEVLDEWDSAPSKRVRKERLELAIKASIRGIRALAQGGIGTLAGQVPVVSTNYDALRYLEDVRQDVALLEAFVAAECRLLEDLGLNREALRRLRQLLTSLLLKGQLLRVPLSIETLSRQLEEVIRVLQQELNQLDNQRRHAKVAAKLTSVFQVLTGGFLIAANAAVAAGTAPVTGGLSLPIGAALSGAAGATYLDRGIAGLGSADL